MDNLIGKSFIFEDDGTTMTIIQIKKKEVDSESVDMITYTISQGRSLPRKLVMPYTDFMGRFGHLFE